MAGSNITRWVTLGVLILAAILSFIDRQILSLVVEPVKADLGISDTQIGLLQGFAFALFYSAAAIPFGWLADRYSRKWIIVGGVTFWSLMTAACGLAQSFWQLFAARLGVGFGEATLGPSVHSIIGDSFEREQLPVAMSIFGVGVSIGAGLAFLVGGQVVEFVAAQPAFYLPLVGELAAWHATFMIVGLPGVALAAVIALVVREPARSAPPPAEEEDRNSLFAYTKSNASLAFGLIGGISLLTAAGFASLAWAAAFYDRTFDWGPGPAGLVIGGALIAAGVPGGVLCGLFATAWAKRGRREAALLTMVGGSAIAAVTGALTYLAPNGVAATALLSATVFFGTCYVGLGPAMVQSIMPGVLRGRAAAWQLLITNATGMTLGPLAVALITDYVWQDTAKLGLSLSIVVGSLTVLGVLSVWSIRGRYLAALDRSEN